MHEYDSALTETNGFKNFLLPGRIPKDSTEDQVGATLASVLSTI
jgi:hypothetical protein